MTTRPFFRFPRRYPAERAIKEIAATSIKAGGRKNLLAILGMGFVAIMPLARAARWLCFIAAGSQIISHLPPARTELTHRQTSLPTIVTTFDSASFGNGMMAEMDHDAGIVEDAKGSRSAKGKEDRSRSTNVTSPRR